MGLLEDNAAMGSWVFDGAVERVASKLIIEELHAELLEARLKAVETKDFSEVDRLKSTLVEAGIEVRMSREGVELVPGPDFDPSKLEALK
jgi:cysteinyl-tRNA synthetase